MSELLDPRGDVADEAGTSAGERRLYRRYAAGLEAHIRVGDTSFPCTIRDLSLGGAGIVPGLPVTPGAEAKLFSEHFERPQGLRARVANVTGDAVHLAFELDEATEEALTLFLLASPTAR